jgi:hypothetical protein
MINSSGRMTIEVLPQRDVQDRWEVQFSHAAPAGGMGAASVGVWFRRPAQT